MVRFSHDLSPFLRFTPPENYDIVKAAVAEKAIPACHIVCTTGKDMKSELSGYLSVLAEQNPAAVGGKLPDDDFYFGA